MKQQDGDINQRTQAKLRSGIRAGEIIKKLERHILNGERMTNTQVRASEILLRKVSPDMVATAITQTDSAKLPLLTIIKRDAPKLVSTQHTQAETPQTAVTHKADPSHSEAGLTSSPATPGVLRPETVKQSA